MPSSFRRAVLGSILPVCLVAAVAVSPATGQDLAKLPPPEELILDTKDGVKLAATYLASNKGKDAPAIILLHMFKGNRRDVLALGELLQKEGCAVIMPDLRGHGESTTAFVNGKEVKFEAATMPVGQFANMITQDMEAVKKKLVEENNAGKLNIERLGIVGAEMSNQVAAKWTVMDWSWPVLPSRKQGQDVKAIVMLSPTMSFRTLNMSRDLQDPKSPIRDKISLLFVAGTGRSRERDGRPPHQRAVGSYSSGRGKDRGQDALYRRRSKNEARRYEALRRSQSGRRRSDRPVYRPAAEEADVSVDRSQRAIGRRIV
ncbi:MAG: hypothetical protein QM775_24645 [Pirellulales bacterium]